MSSTNGYADIEVKPESESDRLRTLWPYDIYDNVNDLQDVAIIASGFLQLEPEEVIEL